MASKIDRVEREFILVSAAEGHNPARIQAQGRTINCPFASADKNLIRFSPPIGSAEAFTAWEIVTVYFDFRGQGFVFQSTVKKTGRGPGCDVLELAYPESMYRGLSRHWPRVRPPLDLSVDLILPDGGLKLPCPVSLEYAEVDLPDSRGNLKADSLATLVESFKFKASELVDENRVVMFKDGKGPGDYGEEIVSKLGRALFIPSVLSGLPIVDPYPDGRVITRADFDAIAGNPELTDASKIADFIEASGRSGLSAALWCPIRYYRYTVGVVYLASKAGSPRPFDFRLLDFAWDFSRLLAWFLKRHGYYDGGSAIEAPRRGAVVDASTTGLLVGLGSGQPRLKTGTRLELILGLEKRKERCSGRVVRYFMQEGRSYYGLAFEGLDPEAETRLSEGLYGTDAATIAGLGG